MMHRRVLAALGAATLLAFGAVASAQETTTAPAAEAAATAQVTEPAAPVTEPTTPAPDAQAAPTTEAPAAAVTPEVAAEPPGRIVFFRPSRLTGAIYSYHVVEVAEDGDSTDETPRLGSLPNGSYFELEVAPGIHNYNIRGPMSVNRNEDRLRLEVESGETYYVEQTVRMGLITGGFALVPSTQVAFERRNLRRSTLNPN